MSDMPPRRTRFVSQEPFDPDETDHLAAQSIPGFWARFKKRRLPYYALVFLIVLYGLLPFIEFLSPYDPDHRHPGFVYAPPQSVRLIHDGTLSAPFVYGLKQQVNTQTFQREFTQDRTSVQHLRLFCPGTSYRFLGFIPVSTRLFCGAEGQPLFLLGADRLGRDIFSRILYGARISLTIGLFGVAIGLILGVGLGAWAGYAGGWVDSMIQRLIELLRSLPELPLWMALAAALPATWSPVWVYFGITLILGLLDWPSLARAVRARVLVLREEEFAVAARLTGASPWRIMFHHLAPNFSSHLIANATLAIPGMILGETALSFLGLGLRAPVTSWGVMLNDAQSLAAIEIYPWLLAPLVPIVLVVLAFNLVGDGLRDAADPFAR